MNSKKTINQNQRRKSYTRPRLESIDELSPTTQLSSSVSSIMSFSGSSFDTGGSINFPVIKKTICSNCKTQNEHILSHFVCSKCNSINF